MTRPDTHVAIYPCTQMLILMTRPDTHVARHPCSQMLILMWPDTHVLRHPCTQGFKHSLCCILTVRLLSWILLMFYYDFCFSIQHLETLVRVVMTTLVDSVSTSTFTSQHRDTYRVPELSSTCWKSRASSFRYGQEDTYICVADHLRILLWCALYCTAQRREKLSCLLSADSWYEQGRLAEIAPCQGPLEVSLHYKG